MPNSPEDQPSIDPQVSESEIISMPSGYSTVLSDVIELMENARRSAARSVNTMMTATYWEIGRRIVEYEQCGDQRADYGEYTIKRLSVDLQTKLGRGFSQRNLEQMRRFYLTWPIPQTVSAELAPSDRPQVQKNLRATSNYQNPSLTEPHISAATRVKSRQQNTQINTTQEGRSPFFFCPLSIQALI